MADHAGLPPRLAQTVTDLLHALAPSLVDELAAAVETYRVVCGHTGRVPDPAVLDFARWLRSAGARSAAPEPASWSPDVSSAHESPDPGGDVDGDGEGGDTGGVVTTALMTADQVADQLGVSVSTVRRRIDAGELTTVRVGRLQRVHPRDLADYIDEHRSTT